MALVIQRTWKGYYARKGKCLFSLLASFFASQLNILYLYYSPRFIYYYLLLANDRCYSRVALLSLTI